MVEVKNLDCWMDFNEESEAYHRIIWRKTGKHAILYKMNVLDYKTNSVNAKPLTWKFDDEQTQAICDFLSLFQNSDDSIDEVRLIECVKFLLKHY